MRDEPVVIIAIAILGIVIITGYTMRAMESRIERLERTQIHLCSLPGVTCIETNSKEAR